MCLYSVPARVSAGGENGGITLTLPAEGVVAAFCSKRGANRRRHRTVFGGEGANKYATIMTIMSSRCVASLRAGDADERKRRLARLGTNYY